MTRLVLSGCAIATMDKVAAVHRSGHIVVEGGRITAVGPGEPRIPADDIPTREIECEGTLATPGLVNTHHHLYQWLTRGYAVDHILFEWLSTLYPVWAHMDEEMEVAAARAGLTALALSGCTTSTDHHYLYPRSAGDLLGAEIEVAREVGIRFHPCRGSMDLGMSQGGLPPDEVVEDRDSILAATEEAITRYHDPSFDSMLKIAVGPCSPFTVTRELMIDSAELARKHGVRLHTHMAETIEEEKDCLERYGVRPVEHLEEMGWLGGDVWLAHCIHLSDDEVRLFGRTGTGVAHCPSSNARLGAGMAPVAPLLRAGAHVGIGVDGVASNENGDLAPEMRMALAFARLREGPRALTTMEALRLGTMGGAECLGREDEIGSLEVGKLADVAVWRMDDLGHAGIADPVAALVLGPERRVDHLIVGGRPIVEGGRALTVDETTVAQEIDKASKRLAERAGVD